MYKLSNIVLYAKGWYAKTNDILEDLRKILDLDGYTPFTLNDVFYILASEFEKFNSQSSKLTIMLIEILPHNCWKYGYDTTDNYDARLASIYYILSTVRFLDKENWNVTRPNYTNISLRPEGKTNKVVNDFFSEIIKQ